MADTLHARDLIVEDALQSRGLMLDNDALLAEQERELNDDINEQRRQHVNDAKGKRRMSQGTLGGGNASDGDAYELQDGDMMRPYDDDGARGSSNNSHHRDRRRQKQREHQHHSSSHQSIAASRNLYDQNGYLQNGDSSAPSISHRRDSFQGTTNSSRTSNRLLGNLLSGDPLKQLENDGGDNKQITKEEVRAAYWKSIFISCLFVLAWYMCSTLISLYNKWMFSPEHYNFGFPLFVTACHMLVQFCLCSLVLSIFPSLRPKSRPQARDYGTKVMPCGLATGLDIGLSNLSLKTITLSFYTMCKSSVLGFVLIWAFIFRLEKPTLPLIGIISVITAGVIMMVSSETQFHFVGMMQVLTASCLSGLRWSLTQILLDKESMGMNNPFATLFWLAPIMGIALAICSIFIEGWFTIFSSEFFDGFDRILVTAGVIILPGVVAFSMNVAEFGLIQRTSVVTLSVAGIFKEVITIFLSTVVFHDQLTPINISGLCVAIVGIGLYNYLKFRNYKKTEKKMLANGGLSTSRGDGGTENEEEEMAALRPVGSTRERDGTQFQLVGEDDFDSSSESGAEDTPDYKRAMKLPNGNIVDEDGIEHLPAYAQTHPHAHQEAMQMEEKVNHDPMLVDIDREERELERQMASSSLHRSPSKAESLLFDAYDDDVKGRANDKDRKQ